MKLRKQILVLSALVLASALPAWAQVDKVAMRTTGVSCGPCAAMSEISLKRLFPGIDKLTISRSQEAIMLSYKPGATFEPKGIRETLKPLKVGITQFQISARGSLQQQGGKQFFVAGKDKFVVAPAAANAPKLPSNTPIMIEGIVNDSLTPMELKVMTFKPLPQ